MAQVGVDDQTVASGLAIFRSSAPILSAPEPPAAWALQTRPSLKIGLSFPNINWRIFLQKSWLPMVPI